MSSGPPLGNIRGQNFVSEEIEIGQGDKILLYTDGAIEPKK
jgi:serine phosphatase RsbU (regulator of sigma subunit)